MTVILTTGVVQPSGIIFAEKGTTTPITLPGDGVLEVDLSVANAYVLATAQTLKGIRLINADSSTFVAHQLPLSTDNTNISRLVMFMLRAEYGGTVTVDTNNLTVPAVERILGSLAGHTLDEKRIQAFAAWHEEIPGWRIDVPDWGIV